MSFLTNAIDRVMGLAEEFTAWFLRERALRAIFVLGALCVAASVFAARRAPRGERSPTLDFVSRQGGIAVTGTLSDLEDVDNTNGMAAVYARLSNSDVQTLMRRYPFTACSAPRGEHGLGMLRAEHRTLPSIDRLRCSSGTAHACVHWTFRLEPSTGKLRVDVSYPDWGGTPRCSD